MVGLKYFIIIGDTDIFDDCCNLLKKLNIDEVLDRISQGTAQSSILESMGINKNDKFFISSFIPVEKEEELKDGLRNEIEINRQGRGIALFIESEVFGGQSSINFFTQNKLSDKGENMEKENNLSLIIAIVNRGFVNTVMDSARNAGATGGTLVKALGVCPKETKLLGMNISEEKEMVYIVVKKEIRNDVMQAIMENAGVNTQAHGIVFSLPVESVVGIPSLENA